MSPEQALNGRNADARSDIYSLGCTLYFLLAGSPLFDGETLMEKLIAHRESPAPRLSNVRDDVPPPLEAIYARMVAKNPDERYASMNAVAEDLRAVLAGRPPSAATALPTAARDGKSTPRWIWAVGAAVVVLLVAIGWAPVRSWLAGADASSDQSPPASDESGKQSGDGVASGAPQSAPPVVGHPDTLANGGPGRAMVVVPQRWFYEDHWTGVHNALQEAGVELVVASSNSGEANPKHGKVKPVPVETTLEGFNVDDFDAVIFLGGATNEFTHKSPQNWELVKQLVSDSLAKDRVVASVGDGRNVLLEAGGADCSFEQQGPLQIGRRKGDQGSIITVDESKYAGQLVREIVRRLRAGS
jgi:putative intracellular protease/amidase